MKKTVIFLIAAFAFANYYSIQLFTASKNKINAVYDFYEKLPKEIKDLSVIYQTDSGYLTVRYMVFESVKELKPFTKLFKHYSIVKDDEQKIKKLFLEKYSQSGNKRLFTILKKNGFLKIPNTKKLKNVKQQQQKVEKNRKPDWLEMIFALHDFDKEKISSLLNKKIDKYQKIEAYEKLNMYDMEAYEIYKSYKPFLAQSYINALKNRGCFYAINTKTVKNDNTTNRYFTLVFSKKDMQASVKNYRILNKTLSSFSLKRNNLEMSVNNISDTTKPGIKYNKKFKNFEIGGGVFQLADDTDLLTLTSLKNFIGLQYTYSHASDIVNFKTSYALYTKLNGSSFFNKYLISVNYTKNFGKFTNTAYIKTVRYSDVLNSYSEIGEGIGYNIKENFFKFWNLYSSFTILYNTKTKTGYIIKTGINRSLIRLDSLDISVGINKNSITDQKELEFLLNYIYFF